MSFGIQNVTNVSMDNLTSLANVSSLPDFLINVNNDIYGGWLYFVLLLVMWIILFFAANQANNHILQNLMYSGAGVSVISLFLRAIEMSQDGVVRGLLSDYQMWVFPIVTILVAMLLWMTKE